MLFRSAWREDYIGVDALSFEVVRITHHGTFNNALVLIDGVLYFGSAKAMAAYVDHIIHTTNDAIQSIFIPACTIARKVEVGISRKVRLSASLMIAPRAAQNGWPRKFEAQVSFYAVACDFLSVGINQNWMYAGHGQAC